MKTRWMLLLVGFWLGSGVYAQTSAPADDSQALVWPRQINEGGNAVVIYQPEFEKWDGNTLEARAAIAVTPAESKRQTFGVIWMTAKTEVDKVNRIVTLNDLKVTKASFPQDKMNEPLYLAVLQQRAPDAARVVPLDQFEATLAASDVSNVTSTMPVQNPPPKVIFSSKPSILILIDGEPVLRMVDGSNAMRVVNSRALILLDAASNQYFLALMGRWASSASPTGPWQAVVQTPDGFDAIRDRLAKAGTIDLLEPKNPAGAPEGLPVIYSASQPTELIQSRGEPQYSPIPDTSLLYMNNTESAVFRQLGTNDFYVLISGRWFKSPDLNNGPWTYVSGKDLPADFAKIPKNHPKANVLVSVPGTPAAKEAVIANSIPQTATVNIADTKLDVAYDGQPIFKDITGTTDLAYATNTATPVILMKDSTTYYAVNNGVWFIAMAPAGPWIVATSVPPAIYTIPVSSPIHYVTYVKIYGATPQVVNVGYTPGYMGTCVASDGVVVYGTGYYYPAYVGTYWVGYPPTYGYGAGFACGYTTGFAFGFAAGAMIGDCWGHAYWGPCRGYGSVDINSHSCYSNWRGGVTTVNRHYEYNSATGKSAGWGTASSFNPYSGRASVGGYSTYVNRESGNFDGRAAGATYNPKTGTITGRGAEVSGNYKEGDATVNRAGFKYNTNTNTGVAHYDNNVYASHDGNVYQHSDNGWQQHTDSGWQNLDRGGAQPAAQQQQWQNLDSQRYSRDLGEQRFDSSRSYGGFQGGGGGGFRRR